MWLVNDGLLLWDPVVLAYTNAPDIKMRLQTHYQGSLGRMQSFTMKLITML